MIPQTSMFVLIYSLLASSIIAQSDRSEPQITAIPSQTRATPSPQTPSVSTISTSFASPAPSIGAWDEALSSAEYLLEELNNHLHIDLRKRQGGVAATNVPQATSIATQLSPVTVYGADRGWPVVTYSQKFSPVPDQWPTPVAGTIGLGTIQGQIGVLKTNSKRMAAPQATGQVIRIRGREVTAS